MVPQTNISVTMRDVFSPSLPPHLIFKAIGFYSFSSAAFTSEPWILSQFLNLAGNETVVRQQDFFTVVRYVATNPIGECVRTTDALGGSLGAGNLPSLYLFFNFLILSINPFPMCNQAASQANWPTVEVWEANNSKGVESKWERLLHESSTTRSDPQVHLWSGGTAILSWMATLPIGDGPLCWLSTLFIQWHNTNNSIHFNCLQGL